MNNFNLSLEDAIAIELFVKWCDFEYAHWARAEVVKDAIETADMFARKLRSRSVVLSLFPTVEETAIDPLWCHVVDPHSTP